jgi:hypothetical protein
MEVLLGCGRSMDRWSDANPNNFWVDRGTTSARDSMPHNRCVSQVRRRDSSHLVILKWPALGLQNARHAHGGGATSARPPLPFSRFFVLSDITPLFTNSSKVVHHLTDPFWSSFRVGRGPSRTLWSQWAGGGSGGGCGSHYAARFVKRVPW